MARVSCVGGVEEVVYRRGGGEVPMSAVGRRQVDPFGDGALDLQAVLPLQFEAADAAARDGIE